MRVLHQAGIQTIMMTGDQASTARAVARQLGLAADGQVTMVDAAELGGMPPERLAERARQAHVFARISPVEKLRITCALQQARLVVAMIGDGINDSPALRAADVGIAMGRDGAQAVREVAEVVLRTDELAPLVVAVERGRATHANVRKAIRYLLATNLREILVVLGATTAGMAGALSPIPLLWINLISDILPGLGLAFEVPEPELMRQPPRPADAAVVGREDLPVLATEGTAIAGSLAGWGWGVLHHGISAEARSMAFGSLVTAQLLHALARRSRRHGPFLGGTGRLPPNRMLAGALGFSFLLQGVALLVPGLRGLLGVVPIGPLDLAVIAAAGTLPYFANEALRGAREVAGARGALPVPVRRALAQPGGAGEPARTAHRRARPDLGDLRPGTCAALHPDAAQAALPRAHSAESGAAAGAGAAEAGLSPGPTGRLAPALLRNRAGVPPDRRYGFGELLHETAGRAAGLRRDPGPAAAAASTKRYRRMPSTGPLPRWRWPTKRIALRGRQGHSGHRG
jgi:Ca2+-transporting ATPase